ncbi:PLP-dependent aminotransferase family protein [Flavitalea sp. BT771]|uniref:MocR-like pyridoxine biosynthesis transcription factor PdxR n=1 Tax=Flavitalea sp. BT771 TaxID=3063329 RepID=UPI0026E31602|nr:PLP-dependent aminotransferase family protein [Flavitalea sp. BT771]MDO6434867.1 PLP-dependent aminotransferase family protein [Flavitalea sp. BT771]MDV6223767.1 PLP-dependent aminotransferase family protein [Flavitalea sp. BT771]
MTPINRLLTIDKDLAVPVYLQIANGIVGIIKQGVLKPGMALPPSRSLSGALGIHRKTVLAAYDELLAQDWVESFERKGLYVSENLPEIKPRQMAASKAGYVYPERTAFPVREKKFQYAGTYTPVRERLVFNDGFPDTRLAPVDLLIREYRRFAHYKFTAKYLSYGPEQGSENLRTALSKFLNETRGLQVSPEQLLITKGVQMALYLTSQVLLEWGDHVIVGEPGYVGATQVLENAGARVNFVPVDEGGIVVDAVEELCRRKKIRLLYLIPHHHNPTTVTLTPARRMQLLELAMKYQFAVLEDDYDFDFQYSTSPILPLSSIDHYGNVIYVGSFCKTIAPAIRIGFMVAPANLIREATCLRRLVDRQGEQLLEEAIANLLKHGDIGRHLKKANKIYHARRDLLCSMLQDELAGKIRFTVPDGGFAVWAQYTGRTTARAVAEQARRMGLYVSTGEEYYHTPPPRPNAVRLGFASMNEKEMEEAVGILKKAIG